MLTGDRLPVGRAVAFVAVAVAVAVGIVALAMVVDVRLLGAAVAPIVAPAIALLGVVWRANR